MQAGGAAAPAEQAWRQLMQVEGGPAAAEQVAALLRQLSKLGA